MKKLLLTLIVALCSVCASAITIDDLCGVYTRHIDNISTSGGMGAAMIADVQLVVSKKDDNTLVFSKMFVADGFPIEGVVDFAASTITFAPGQIVGYAGEFPQVFAISWGGSKGDEPIVGTFDDNGVITIGDEYLPYVGFCLSLPTGIDLFQAQGVITLTRDNTLLWQAQAAYQLGDGTFISGESILKCCDRAVTDYDYSIELSTYWGKYDLQIIQNEDGSLSLYEAEAEVPYTNSVWFWWMKDYEYPAWSEYLQLYTANDAGIYVARAAGNADGGTIALGGNYRVFAADTEAELENEDLEPVISESTRFTITWGDPTIGVNAVQPTQANSQAIYTLSGQRVNKATHGIYIMNGRKYIVK